MTITVLRASRDAGGDIVGTPAEHTVSDCAIAPGDQRTEREGTIVGEQVRVDHTVFAPFDADVLATDQVRIDEAAWAGTYDVVGEPRKWQSPFTGSKPGTVVALTRTG